MLIIHRVVRKNRHEGEQRSTNAGVRHRAVRKDTHADAERSPAGAASSCGQKRHAQDGATANTLITQTILSSSHTAAPHVSAAAGKRRDLPLRNGFPWLWNCKAPGEAVGFRHHCKNAATSAATRRWALDHLRLLMSFLLGQQNRCLPGKFWNTATNPFPPWSYGLFRRFGCTATNAAQRMCMQVHVFCWNHASSNTTYRSPTFLCFSHTYPKDTSCTKKNDGLSPSSSAGKPMGRTFSPQMVWHMGHTTDAGFLCRWL